MGKRLTTPGVPLHVVSQQLPCLLHAPLLLLLLLLSWVLQRCMAVTECASPAAAPAL